MPSATDRLEFAPPPARGLAFGFTLALLAHLLLIAALTWGLKWKRDSQDAVAEAELWSSVPQQAAPKEVAPPPPPPQPVAKPEPKPAPPPPEVNEAEIALEKQRKAAEAKRREEELAARRKEEAEKKRKLEEQKLALEKQRKEEAEKKRRQQQLEEQRLAKQREERIKALQGMAGATGAPSATGTALRSAGPSTSWAGMIRARVRPNIVFTDDVAGNPSADVEVRLAPDGTITGKRLVKSSGNKGWDEAVLRALDKTEVLPRDTDGRVHSPVVIEFKPKG